MNETLISVDIEADGPIPGRYSMLSLGACIVGKPNTSFYMLIQPISDEFVPEALAVSGLDRDALLANGATPTIAMYAFRQWITEVCPDTKPVFASFSTWDWVFVYWYLIQFSGSSPFGHSSLDMKSYIMGKYRSDWRLTSKRSLAKEYPELLAGLGPHTHNALEDAQEQGQLMQRLMEPPKHE